LCARRLLWSAKKILHRCSEGHEWLAKPNNIRSGKGCPHCSGRIPDKDRYPAWLASNRPDITVLESFINVDTKLLHRCEAGHEWKVKPSKIKEGSSCPFCKLWLKGSQYFYGDDDKECHRCGEIKAHSRFSANQSLPDGLNKWCKLCMKSYKRRYDQRPTVKEINRKRRAEQYWRDHDIELERMRLYHLNNNSRVLERQRQYYKDNVTYMRSRAAKRRALQIKRTPAWASWHAINAIYEERDYIQQKFGTMLEVDHIIPLQGELVSGLHVETNLQLIDPTENKKKSNNFDPLSFDAHKGTLEGIDRWNRLSSHFG
jgi:hypothetical protein